MVSIPTASPAQPLLFRNRSFTIVILSQFVSRTGDGLLTVASVLLVLELTGNNPLASSIALAVQFLPFLLFGLAAGALVDRWDRRLTMAGADLAAAVMLLAVPLLHVTGLLHVWHVIAVNFALISVARLAIPAQKALIPDLVAPDQLVRANAIAEGSGQAAMVLGPALGGVLVAAIGAANVFTLDAVSFVLSALALLLLRLPKREAAPVPRHSLGREVLDGLRHVRTSTPLATGILLAAAGNVAFTSVPALLPVLVFDELGGTSRTVGVLIACFFTGSVAGSVLIGRRGESLHRGRALIVGVITVGVATLMVAAAVSSLVAGGALVLVGGAAAAFNVALYSLLQEKTAAELRGRVFAVTQMSSQCARPLALLVAGTVAYSYGPRAGIGALALVAVAAGLATLAGRTLRETP